MRWRRPGLRLRLLASLVLTSLLATVLVGATVLVLRRNALLADVAEQARRQIDTDLLEAGDLTNQLGTYLEDPDTGRTYRVLPEAALDLLGRRLTELSPAAFLVWQPAGAEEYVSSLQPTLPRPLELVEIVEQGLVGHMRLRVDDRPLLAVGGRVAVDGLHVYRFYDLAPIETELAALTRTIALSGAVPLVLGLVLGLIAATGLVRPLRRARDAAQRIGAGDLDVRLPVTGEDELAELSRSFNDMATSLQSTIDELVEMEARQRRFVADVSHELRTPLTALVAAVEVLEEELGDAGIDADRREATLLAVGEVRAMRELVEDLMEITRFDAGRADLRESEVELRAAVAGTLARRGWHDALIEVPADLRVYADPRRLDTIVANLVANARTHGRPPVVVRAEMAAESDVVLEVADHGDGVGLALREHLFERFTKGDEARSRTTGSGLGLAIARENARLHGGDLVLVVAEEPGARFRLALPGRHRPAGASGSGAMDVATGTVAP